MQSSATVSPPSTSSPPGNVEELGWDYTEMELDPTGTCGLFDGMLLDWDDDTPDERREHEEYFPDAFTVGARILVDDWDHELSNDEVCSRCFLIIEHADQFTDHDTGRDWLCESTLADFSEVEAMTFFQNLTLMEPQDIAELGGRPIIPSAGPEECRAAVLAFNQKMIARRRERGLGDTADPSKVKKTAPAPKSAAPKREQAIRGLGRVDFSGLGYGWGTQYYPDSLSVDAIGIDYQSGERNTILNFSPSRMPSIWTAGSSSAMRRLWGMTATRIHGPAPLSDRISGPSTARRPASSPRTSGSTAWRPVRARSLVSTRRGSRGAKRSRSRRP